MDRESLFEELEKILKRDGRLIQLPSQGKVVFVGDTHGDLEATQKVISHYLIKPNRIVFLGDYVDRGNHSQENIDYLLQIKREHPEELFLLTGNHEGHMVKELSPANFWDSLPFEEKTAYGSLFSRLPLAACSPNGILALHGGLPELNTLEELNHIDWGDPQWDRIVWGDFIENEGDILGDWWGRPQFGQAYFDRLMDRYQKKLLIRSHQPHAPRQMFQKRCVTIFTSNAYRSSRTIAIADLEKDIQTADDVRIESI